MKKRLMTMLLVVATFIMVACTPAVEAKYQPTHFDPSGDLDYDVEEILDERITTIIKNELEYINQKYSVDLLLPEYKVYKVVEPTAKDTMVRAETHNGNIYLYPLYFVSPSSSVENIAHEAVHLLYHSNYGYDTYFAKNAAGDHSFYGIFFEEAYADIISREFLRECYPDEYISPKPAYWVYVSQVESLDVALGEATASYFIRNDYEGFSHQINDLAEAKGQKLGEDTAQLFAALFDKTMYRTTTMAGLPDQNFFAENMRFIARCTAEDKLSMLGDVIANNGITLQGGSVADLAKPIS